MYGVVQYYKSGLLASSLQLEVKCVVFCTSTTRGFYFASGYSLCSRSILFATWNIHTLVENAGDDQRICRVRPNPLRHFLQSLLFLTVLIGN